MENLQSCAPEDCAMHARDLAQIEQIWESATAQVLEDDWDALGTLLGVVDPKILTLPDDLRELEPM